MSSGSNPYSVGSAGQFPDAGNPFGQPSVPLSNYLVQAILVTFCCCLPFGIVAIVYAAQVNGKIASGDHAGAKVSSDKARMWCWIAFGFGIVSAIVGIIFQAFVIYATIQEQNVNGMGGF